MAILEAAKVGDVSFLRKAYEDNVGDLESYFLGRKVKEMLPYPKDIVLRGAYRSHTHYNILHAAVRGGQYSFLCEALEMLKSHPTLIIHLICQTENRNFNCLHYAVEKGNIYVVKLLVHAYVTAIASSETCQETLMPPWLWLNGLDQTPLGSCFVDKSSNEGIAMYLVLQDQRLGRDRYPPKHKCGTMNLDTLTTSVVYAAMRAGWSLLVEHILTSDFPYNLDGFDFVGERHTPLHYASKCNAKVSKLLLEKHPELVNVPSNVTVLHAAVEDGATCLVKLMLVGDETWIKACRRLMWHKNNRGETPLHISARLGGTEIAELIIQAYYSTIQDEGTTWDADVEARPEIPDMGVNLLLMKNSDGKVPLLVALRNKHDDCGVMLTKQTFQLRKDALENIHREALLDAVNAGCRQSIKTIIALLLDPDSYYIVSLLYGRGAVTPAVGNIFKYLARKYEVYHKMLESEELEKLSKVLPELLKEPVKDLKTILTEAAERGKDWLVTLCLESDQDLLMESARAWQVACENGYVSTLLTFISKFGDQEFIKHCRSIKQTPLHHIKLKQNGEYLELLKNYPILEGMKNEIDTDDYTPLHQAIQRDNLELAKALLQTKGIEVSIEGNNGTRALLLLEDRRKHSDTWHEQYIELLKNPRFEELKNQTDSDKATPLHRAIERDDLELTKTLLEIKDINVWIQDKNCKTASDLLEDRRKFDRKWDEMCRQIKQYERVENRKYFFRSITFEGMQNSLSVVAALVATITFAAGITVPGGVDGSNGEAVLSTKAAFLVFSVSNTTAMCSSVMVLFLLLGPMMWDPQLPLFYVKLSLYLLLLSLGGTMLAFMTGVYATMINKVKWNAIFILVSCSLTLFVACIILLSTYSRRFKWLTKVCNTIHHRILHISEKAQPSSPLLPVSTDITTTSTIQSQPGSANMIVSQVSGSLGQVPPQLCQEQTQNTEMGQFSRTSPKAAVDVKIDIQYLSQQPSMCCEQI